MGRASLSFRCLDSNSRIRFASERFFSVWSVHRQISAQIPHSKTISERNVPMYPKMSCSRGAFSFVARYWRKRNTIATAMPKKSKMVLFVLSCRTRLLYANSRASSFHMRSRASVNAICSSSVSNGLADVGFPPSVIATLYLLHLRLTTLGSEILTSRTLARSRRFRDCPPLPSPKASGMLPLPSRFPPAGAPPLSCPATAFSCAESKRPRLAAGS